MFHFYGATPVGDTDSLAVYETYALDYYIDEWQRQLGSDIAAVVRG